MRILICGGRDYDDREELFYEVTHSVEDWRNAVIISGMARGADALGVDFAKTYGLELLEFPADWDRYKKAAGPIRNQQMIDEGKPDIVLAFPTKNSRGTYDMIRRAKSHGIKTIVFEGE